LLRVDRLTTTANPKSLGRIEFLDRVGGAGGVVQSCGGDSHLFDCGAAPVSLAGGECLCGWQGELILLPTVLLVTALLTIAAATIFHAVVEEPDIQLGHRFASAYARRANPPKI
jgi:hypothetical protein